MRSPITAVIWEIWARNRTAVLLLIGITLANSIDSYLDQGSNDIRTLLPRDTNCYVVWFWEGDVPGRKMDIFPVRVLTQAVDTNTEDPAKVSIEFAITRIPAINVAIPA